MPSQALNLDTINNQLVATVGMKIRHFRALAGISRKILSSRAQVSQRHLAQIETGTGNVSIRLLDQIANALGVQAHELLLDQSESSALELILQDALANLTPRQTNQVVEFAQNLAPAPPQSINVIALIGLRGAGKSTLGHLLAKSRQVAFVRLSEAIEELAGMAIAEIYALSGEAGYRRYELLAVNKALADCSGCIIEAGGSLVANSAAFNRLLKGSFVIWVQTSPIEHMQRVINQGDMRPMENRADAMEDLVGILNERDSFYSRAHARINTSSKSVAESMCQLEDIADTIWSNSQ